jgi:hypothetical protein
MAPMAAVREMEPGWKFKPKTKDDMGVDPFQDEFFKTGYVGGFSDALLRETIQNSLDAKADGNEPVQVLISIYRNVTIFNDPQYHVFFNGLSEHLNAPRNGISDRPKPSTSLDFLVIEDFNTTGLAGDPERADVPEDGSSGENFFYFWRNYGRSGKSGKERGRWGLGKTVFSAVSRINTFFGLTIRENDQRALLLGQSVLKIHNIGNQSFMPYGGFGKFGDLQGEQFFPVPVEDKPAIENFTALFRLKRMTEPGLSVVVPFPYPDITAESLKAGVIKQFFYPIMAGTLAVTIHEGDIRILLDRQSILKMISDGKLLMSENNGEIEDINLIKLFYFAQQAIEMRPEEYISLMEPEKLNVAPHWEDTLFEGISLHDLRKKFDAGTIIGFRIPVKVQIKGHKQIQVSRFKAFVQRDGKLQVADNYFIREGIRISGVTSFKDKGIRGMVVIDEGELTTLIGDAENPAHTEWQKNSSKFLEKYHHGPSTLDFVKASLREIIHRLMKPAEGVDKELLGEIFYADIPEDRPPEVQPGKKPVKKRKGDKPDKGPLPDIKSRTRPVLITKISGGVRIYQNPDSPKKISSAEIRFAYAVRKGNALLKYRPPDFDLGKEPMSIRGSGYSLTRVSENILRFDITDPSFDMTVTGFDEQRDLVIRSQYGEALV